MDSAPGGAGGGGKEKRREVETREDRKRGVEARDSRSFFWFFFSLLFLVFCVVSLYIVLTGAIARILFRRSSCPTPRLIGLHFLCHATSSRWSFPATRLFKVHPGPYPTHIHSQVRGEVRYALSKWYEGSLVLLWCIGCTRQTARGYTLCVKIRDHAAPRSALICIIFRYLVPDQCHPSSKRFISKTGPMIDVV